jgi:hypothetical protein
MHGRLTNMSKLYEVKVWITVEAENKTEVFEKLDEVLGYAIRQRSDFESFGIDDLIDLGEEVL